MEELKYALRATRDTLLAQLGLAASRPLLDLPVSIEKPMVSYGNHTWVAVAHSQRDVRYELRDSAGNVADAQMGTGDVLQLQTDVLVNEEYSFRVWAARVGENVSEEAGGALLPLLQGVSVRVGLDTALAVSLQGKVIDFGASTTVVVHDAQSRVRYELLDEATQTPLGEAVETETSGDISLPTAALTEDTTLVVRATNPKTNLSDLLTQRVQVLVLPDVDLEATLTPLVVDYNSPAIIRLAGSQASTTYQLQLENTSLDTTLAPPEAVPAVPGTGKALKLPTRALLEDAVGSITATKMASGRVAVLRVRVSIPVRPDPAKELALVQDLTEAGKNTVLTEVVAGTAAVIRVANTQRGVRYQLRAAGSPVGRPVYHHINAGIGKGRVGLELAVDTFSGENIYLPTGVLTQTTEFSVYAFKPTREAEGVEVGTLSVVVRPEPA